MCLGEKSHLRMMPEREKPRIRCLRTGYNAGKGGFSGAINTDNGYAVPLLHCKIIIFQQANRSVGFAHLIQPHYRTATGGRRRKTKTHHRIVVFHLNELNFFQLFNTALGLAGLSGFGTETVNKRLGFSNFSLLSFSLSQQDFLAGFAFLEVEGKIAGILFCTAMVECDGTRHHRIKQSNIMADDANGSSVTTQALLQPTLALNIQMVGRLVQQQHLRLLQ